MTRTLVVGYGNVGRGDDGAGPKVAELLSARALPDVSIRSMHQLQPELAEELAEFQRVVFVDASLDGPDVRFRRLRQDRLGTRASTHFLGPHALLELSRHLNQSCPEAYLCSILGESFGFGSGMSPAVVERAMRAAGRIAKLCRKGIVHA